MQVNRVYRFIALLGSRLVSCILTAIHQVSSRISRYDPQQRHARIAGAKAFGVYS